MTVLSYFLTIWDVIIWIFTGVVAAIYTSGGSFIIQPMNVTLQIILVFATIPCLILVFKRNIIGAAIYMGIYVSYYGTALFNTLNNINNGDGLNINGNIELMVSIVCIIVPILTFIDVLLNKHRKSIISGNSSTDWYYKNKKFDRKLDERADKNQYKIR